MSVAEQEAWQQQQFDDLKRRATDQQETIERLRDIALDAYRAGALAAHEDTVEGRYNMAHAPDSDEPQEWLDDYLRETKILSATAAEADYERAEKDAPCSVCAGERLLNCICEGAGTATGEAHGLRMVAAEKDEKIERLRAVLADIADATSGEGDDMDSLKDLAAEQLAMSASFTDEKGNE